ncbi:MAG: hypothetical protein KDD27_05465, partial [Saprospiraceae bacterium]|nr:hypothetical protein [Saprospiraceae bacterium]
LYDFFSPLNPTVNLCDPKVIYDPGADRFILFTQGCDGFAIPNQVLLAFSQTNNPTNSWWVYGLTGDPLGNNSWLDYPKIGISNNEFYLTGNLYSSSGNYVQSVIYQITKASGYGGNNSLQWQFWSNIAGNPFTLQPLSWGHGSTYGPGIYLVASRSGGGNIIQFYDLTNDMTASNETLNYMPVTVDAYTVPPPGLQPNGLYMDTGDNRMMDGFYLNGTAHFVFSEAKGDWSAIRYNRLDVANLAYQYQQTYNTGVRDYSYGSVASFTNDPSDKTVLVGFVAVGESNAPEYRVKYYGDNMETASSILVKGGTGSVSANFCYDPDREFVRWGDYTGMSRKHNSSNPKIWTSSCFGKSNGSWGTWIAEINDDGNVPVLENDGPAIGLNVAPNPASNGRFTVNVRVEAIEEADFKLIDQQGKTVANLYRGHLLPGENQFSFLQDALATGAYYLVITSTSTHKILANEKVMVTH